MTDRVEGPVSLYSLATWINGLAFKSINFSAAGMPVIKISEVKNGLTSQTKFTDGSYDLKFLVEPGAMIFCWSGQPETSIGTFYWRGPRGWLNQHLFKVIPDAERVDPEYFYFLMQDLKSLFVQLARNKQTTGLGHVTKQDLIRSEVTLPPLDEQRRIAEALGALDHLVETNERSIEKLVETFDAQSWETAFSTAEVIELGSKISLQKGVSYKGAFLAESGLPLINLASFSRVGSITEQGTKYYTGPVPPRKMLRQGDLVVANTDLTQERLLLGRPTIVMHETATSTHHTFQVAVEDPIDRLWVYSLLRHGPRREYLASFATGTTVTALPADALMGIEVPWPDRERLEKWHQVTAPLLEGARALEIENSELRRTRDELLPLLMSGAVRVRPEGVAA